ncbi:hypothetical protein ABBQ32_011660 [Trebouxia sp. C0010 RCD-2024]
MCKVAGQLQCVGAGGDSNAAARALLQASCPMFEAFWQGRLIPGARIDSLPFVEMVRAKRTAASKDTLPDEVFMRIRGALFFGAGFKVTRNKLLFRDNLQELLAAAVPGDRLQEKKFREWLVKCHSQLDKSLRFENLADATIQEAISSKTGGTAFNTVIDGQRTLQSGDALRLTTKPVLVGRALYFVVGQVVKEGGVYANGQVVVQPLPTAMYGGDAQRTIPLRRLEAVLTEEQLELQCAKEMQKAPAEVLLEPKELSAGTTFSLSAGAAIPETSARVTNGLGQPLVKALLGGQKIPLTLVQRLWRLKDGQELGEAQPSGEASAVDHESEQRPEAKKGRKGKKKAKGAAVAAAALQQAETAGSTPSRRSVIMDPSKGDLIQEVSNRIPVKEDFQFSSIAVRQQGTYVLQYEVQPHLPGLPALTACTTVAVSAGLPISLELQGEGRAAAASKDLMLGEHLPPLTLLCKDALGNNVPMSQVPPGLTLALKPAPPRDAVAELAWEASDLDVDVSADLVVEEGTVKLKHLQVLGKPAISAGLAIFPHPATAGSLSPQNQARFLIVASPKQELPSADLIVCVYVPDMPAEQLRVRLRPGAPHRLHLHPDHPWCPQIEQGDDQGAKSSPSALTAAKLSSGEALPTFWVQTLDKWGNHTGPTPDLPFNLIMACDALQSSPMTAAFNDVGVAKVKGLTAGTASLEACPLSLSLQLLPSNPLAEAACTAAGQPDSLHLPVLVQPSTAPASIQLLVGDDTMPYSADCPSNAPVVIIENVPAGSVLSDLGFFCLDEAQQPVHGGILGKVQLSWSRGSKNVVLEEGIVCLPDMPVSESTAEVMMGWIRFVVKDSTAPAVELTIQVNIVAADPVAWGMAIVAGNSQPTPRDQGEVQCGQPFTLEVCAHDKFGHRHAAQAIVLLH